MLTTLDQLVPVPPRAPTVPTDFADADALAAWLNTHPAATGERAARPWEPDLTQDGEALIVWCAVPQDADHVAHLVGYWFTGPAAMPGEWGVDPVPPEIAATGRLFRFWCDSRRTAEPITSPRLTVTGAEVLVLLKSSKPIVIDLHLKASLLIRPR